MRHEAALYGHKEEVHFDFSNRRYGCSNCNRRFYAESDKEAHERVGCAGPSVGLDYVCQRCGSPYERFSTLVRHLESFHGDFSARPHHPSVVKQYVCERCGKDYKIFSSLAKHLENVHGDFSARPLQCAFCNKRYKVVGAKETHEETCTASRTSSSEKAADLEMRPSTQQSLSRDMPVAPSGNHRIKSLPLLAPRPTIPSPQ